MLNFFLSLFNKKTYSLGAFQNPEDIRDIHISSVQAPVTIPSSYKSDISMLDVENQKAHGTCVGQAITKLVEFYWYRRFKSLTKLSARSLYIRSKALDGIPNLQGTIPRVAANVVVKEGIATDTFVPDNNDLSYTDYMAFNIDDSVKANMGSQKLPGYVFVTPTFQEIKQAIYQNGVVTGSLPVDNNWFLGVIKRVFDIIGYHYTLWYGYDEYGIYARNSWGTGWVGKALNLVIPQGDFYFLWADYQDRARDIIAFTDIPKEILENVKKVRYQFTSTMNLGDKSNAVLELQKRLGEEGLWPITSQKTGYYGTVTAEAVYKYQTKYKVAPQTVLDELLGRTCGPATIKELNKNTMTSKIDLWCEATKEHEGYFAGSRSFRNNNPGNIKYIGQKSATGQDKDGFCIFPDYETGYNELKNMFIRACLGNSRVYKPEMTLLDFYKVYAPSSDNNNPQIYAQFVAKRIGVDITTQIKTLI